MSLGRRKFMSLSVWAALNASTSINRAGAASDGGVKPRAATQRLPGIAGTTMHPHETDDMKLKLRIKSISNVFEVGKTEADYGYVENLDDGRGLTVTSYGFCSCNDEVTNIIRFYDPLAPGNSLGRFLSSLPPADDGLSPHRLAGFSDAWSEEVKATQLLPEICEMFADRLYFDPAAKFAQDTKIVTPIGRAIIYDTLLQHGGGSDEDSLRAIYKRAAAQTAWPLLGKEQDFLLALLETRRAVLTNPHNSDTADVWRESLPRVDALRNLVNNNPQLRSPILVRNAEVSVTVL